MGFNSNWFKCWVWSFKNSGRVESYLLLVIKKMTLLEKIWFLISVLIIFIILTTDPKNSINGTWGSQTIFASASDSQKFIKQFNWVLITAFFLITIGLSYFV